MKFKVTDNNQVNKSFGNDLFNVLQDLIEDDEINEEFGLDFYTELTSLLINDENLSEGFNNEADILRHFNRHCLGKFKKNKSIEKNVKFDFTTPEEYIQFEQLLNKRCQSPNHIIISLDYLNEVKKYTEEMLKGNYVLQLCDKKLKDRIVNLISYTDGVTTNYPKSTIGVYVTSTTGTCISLYPIDKIILETKLTNLMIKYFGEAK